MKLFFRTFGNGPPLIILHGLFGSSDNWITIAKKLSSSFNVILPDLRNHGLSPHSDTHDYISMRDDLYQLADELKLKKFFLAGHSMGGKCAVSFALKWPEKLYGLLVADISPFATEKKTSENYSQHLHILKAITAIDLTGITTRNEVELLLSPVVKSEKIRGLIMKNLQRNPDNSFTWKINASSLLLNFDNIIEPVKINEEENLPVTGFPVIFLKGRFSDYIPVEDFKMIKEIFPAVEFIEVPDAGHWIQSDNPEAVKNSLLKLLDIQ